MFYDLTLAFFLFLAGVVEVISPVLDSFTVFRFPCFVCCFVGGVTIVTGGWRYAYGVF